MVQLDSISPWGHQKHGFPRDKAILRANFVGKCLLSSQQWTDFVLCNEQIFKKSFAVFTQPLQQARSLGITTTIWWCGTTIESKRIAPWYTHCSCIINVTWHIARPLCRSFIVYPLPPCPIYINRCTFTTFTSTH